MIFPFTHIEFICFLGPFRFWSPASASAAFHHHAMHAVVQALTSGLRPKVRNLKRLRVWSDGDKKAYKVAVPSAIHTSGYHIAIPRQGYPNFGRMSYWPKEKPASPPAQPNGFEDAEGIEIIHCFFVSYHGSGVQVSYSSIAPNKSRSHCHHLLSFVRTLLAMRPGARWGGRSA